MSKTTYTPKCKIAIEVLHDISKRSEMMRVKHKCTFDKVDKDLISWLEEAYEEQMDNLMYMKKAINKLKRRS